MHSERTRESLVRFMEAFAKRLPDVMREGSGVRPASSGT